MAERTCEHDGCERKHWARGLCATHYSTVYYRPQHDRDRKRHAAVCVVCGAAFMSTKQGAKYCSTGKDSCLASARSKPDQRRAKRWARAEAKLAKAARLPSTVKCWRAGPCVECGKTFVSSQWSSIACSALCSKRSQRRRSKRRRAARYGWNDSNRARARRLDVAYETVSTRQVFERDGYRCGICRKLTKRDAKVPHPRAPTLDHIVPMSKGGPHLYSNVQCACFECNWRKADGAGNDQLRLVG